MKENDILRIMGLVITWHAAKYLRARNALASPTTEETGEQPMKGASHEW